ncbi:TRAP transporter small permease [Aquisalibacillus elongatus]|uniref:TRAP-type C4-dicarboxylate transport system permease small subunit n=1 Tax=Aquisalibacillus elongatus TaxID=485577 RepID=A0A3N5BA93_9BACI|nr:TRAP transporter small permease [Aquisalibacillus elongatus]RPF54323.1 TRAP-type C4-dicarboxylate transport system permease small subunit [Aquisalibacillus elongatus]
MLKKIDTLIYRIVEIIVGLTLTATVVVTFLQVLFRYVIQQPLTWSQEVLMISFVYSILFGAALLIHNSGHLTVDLFEEASGIKIKVLKVLEFLVVGFTIVFLIYYGIQLVQNNLDSGQTLGFLDIQKAYVYLALPVSAILMFYFHVRKVFR